MDRIRRNERLAAMTRILVESPNKIFTLGTFCEMFNAAYWDEKGIRFVTDNWSWSRENVFRGLHYQTVNPQGKLVSVADGVILDICVDVRVAAAGLVEALIGT